MLNQLSCSSRTAKDNTFKKHSSIYSSHSPDTLVSSPLGVIHHPAYRNSYSTVCIGSLAKFKSDIIGLSKNWVLFFSQAVQWANQHMGQQ